MWLDKVIKKRFETETAQNVLIAKGTAMFQGVRLTVRCFVIDGVLIDTGAKSMENEFTSFSNNKTSIKSSSLIFTKTIPAAQRFCSERWACPSI